MLKIIKKGDIYALGEHVLMCGDSHTEHDMGYLMGTGNADMVFTDPPYNQETRGGSFVGTGLRKSADKVDFMSNFDPKDFLIRLMDMFLPHKMNAFIFCNKDLIGKYLSWAEARKYKVNILVWKKPNGVPIGNSYRPDIEYLLVFRRNGVFNNGIEGVNYSKLLEHKRVKDKLHPTMKPLELIENQILIASNKRDVVVDPYGGSGSTLIACENTNRRCLMMEIDPDYCNVIIERWEKHTGKIHYRI